MKTKFATLHQFAAYLDLFWYIDGVPFYNFTFHRLFINSDRFFFILLPFLRSDTVFIIKEGSIFTYFTFETHPCHTRVCVKGSLSQKYDGKIVIIDKTPYIFKANTTQLVHRIDPNESMRTFTLEAI